MYILHCLLVLLTGVGLGVTVVIDLTTLSFMAGGDDVDVVIDGIVDGVTIFV